MKILFTTLLIVSSFATIGQISFKTGDATLETELNVVNKDALADLATFKKNLSIDFGVTMEKVETLLKSMIPAEALLAVKIASITKQPVEKVIESYKVNKDKGWGAIAKDMGIKPGSPEFHALKGNKSKGANSGNGNGNSKGKGKS
ncbi:MAG: hypothetical protein RI883_70 [Bacteroidota bacterium]|jgi:hypothetical protein